MPYNKHRNNKNVCQSSNNNISFACPAKLVELKLTAKNLEKLLELQNKNININEIIEKALSKRETEIAQAKASAAIENLKPATNTPFKSVAPTREYDKTITKPPSRHIPAKIRKIIDAEQGDKCTAPGCNKPAQIIHHELPFAMAKNHDPNNLKKLCREHHEIRHTINIKFLRIKNTAINTG